MVGMVSLLVCETGAEVGRGGGHMAQSGCWCQSYPRTLAADISPMSIAGSTLPTITTMMHLAAPQQVIQSQMVYTVASICSANLM